MWIQNRYELEEIYSLFLWILSFSWYIFCLWLLFFRGSCFMVLPVTWYCMPSWPWTHNSCLHLKVLRFWMYTTIHWPLSFIFFLQCLFNFPVFLETTLSLYSSPICCLSLLYDQFVINHLWSISIFLSIYLSNIYLNINYLYHLSIYLSNHVDYLPTYLSMCV